jgi:uncharacterized protein YdeI (YjbR/CyaY-like superfamily)
MAAPTFFATPAAFCRWLKKHHAEVQELLVGFYKKESGKPSITWSESIDEALCVGWIDGIRKRMNDEVYTIRFSPRRRGSVWSAVNMRRAEALIAAGRMQPAGLAAYEARKENKVGTYSYEQRTVDLPEPYQGLLKKNKAAWKFFAAQPPSYRKAISWWIACAKKDETRQKRLRELIGYCVNGERLPMMASKK